MQASTERPALQTVRKYWDEHIHDQHISTSPVGSAGFFRDLEEYRFDKLHYLPCLVDFGAYEGKAVLEVGCGAGIDLACFANRGALVTGVDVARRPIELARRNFSLRGLHGQFCQMDGENLGFRREKFDLVYAHGVLQYTPKASKMIREIHRVLAPGGEAILMVYNKYSWLLGLSKIMHVGIEHRDAPAFHVHSTAEFRKLLRPFDNVRIVPERFPVATRLHRGLKATLYNGFFVKAFNVLPRAMVRPFAWHLVAFATKA